MKTITLTIELTYDDQMMYLNDMEARDWFFQDILREDELSLFSEEMGDEVGSVKVLAIQEILPTIQMWYRTNGRESSALVPLVHAVDRMSEKWIAAGNYSERTVRDLRDALRKFLGTYPQPVRIPGEPL